MHLLNEERGAVIETIVARTLRLVSVVVLYEALMKLIPVNGQVEFSQTLIRIVGLSATLPNYIDVSDFLR